MIGEKIYTDGIIITSQGFKNVDIFVDKNGYIGDICQAQKKQKENRQIINLKKKIVISGLINTHIHLGDTILCSFLKENITLEKFLSSADKLNINNPSIEIERKKICKYTLLKAVLNGTTTIAGARVFPHTVEFGVKSYSGYILMKSKKLGFLTKNFINNFEVEKTKDNRENVSALFIHSLEKIDIEILEALSSYIQNNKDTRLMIHVSETKKSETVVQKKYGISSIQVLANYNLLSPNIFLIHANCISDNDIKLIRESGSHIVQCPSTNLYLDKNILSLDRLLKIKNNLIIATDGSATSGTYSLLNEARLAYLYHNRRKNIITAEECLEMITRIPAQALGYNKYNLHLSPGMSADFITLETDYRIIGDISPYKEILLNTDNHKIDKVVASGKLIVTNGKCVNINQKKITDEYISILEQIKYF